MNHNSSLAQQLFRAKLTHLVGSHRLKPSEQLLLDQAALHYSPRALNRNLIAFISTRQPDLIKQLPELYAQATQEAQTHQFRSKLAPPKPNLVQDSTLNRIFSFFKKILPQSHNQSSEIDPPTRPIPNSLHAEYTLNALSQPFIDGLVSLKVWDAIKMTLSPLEQRRWQKKLNQDKDGQSFMLLQQLYEQKTGKKMAELVDQLYQETTAWLANLLIDAAKQTERWQKSGLNKTYLEAVQNNNFEEMLKVMQKFQQLQKSQ